MKWRRQSRSFHDGARASRIYENETGVAGDFGKHAHPRIEIVQIGAAAERDVLTIVNLLAIRESIGRRPATQKRTLLEQFNVESGFS